MANSKAGTVLSGWAPPGCGLLLEETGHPFNLSALVGNLFYHTQPTDVNNEVWVQDPHDPCNIADHKNEELAIARGGTTTQEEGSLPHAGGLIGLGCVVHREPAKARQGGG
jgi:hypothetical protein